MLLDNGYKSLNHFCVFKYVEILFSDFITKWYLFCIYIYIIYAGPFSKTAVNFNAGCRTAMSNVVMAIFMGLTLLFLAPLFSYTPLVALSAIIMSAMFGLIKYEEAHHLLKVDKFDFVICMAAFLGVSFVSMDVGLMLSVIFLLFWLNY